MIDQIKIGKFIASKRKEKSLTQAEVAKQYEVTSDLQDRGFSNTMV